MPAASPQLRLADAPLKQLLRLFAPEAPLHIRALGDTWHPSAGYVSETLAAGVTQVGELLAFPYDFVGLIYLEAIVADIAITYRDSCYRLAGPLKPLQQLRARLRALNACSDTVPLVLIPTSLAT